MVVVKVVVVCILKYNHFCYCYYNNPYPALHNPNPYPKVCFRPNTGMVLYNGLTAGLATLLKSRDRYPQRLSELAKRILLEFILLPLKVDFHIETLHGNKTFEISDGDVQLLDKDCL